MNWKKPAHPELMHAVAVYLQAAYAGASVPRSVAAKVDTLNVAAGDTLYETALVENDASAPGHRFSIRLGNGAYPHMKLVIERSPDGQGHLFRADTHDRHIRPQPGTRDADLFAQLMVDNGRIAEAIEAAWEQAGVPTFKAFLRNDLARRAAAVKAEARS